MRDPNRIPTVLAALERVWYRYPDLRLGQLVVNASSVADPSNPGPKDPFYCEDDQMLLGLKRLTEK